MSEQHPPEGQPPPPSTQPSQGPGQSYSQPGPAPQGPPPPRRLVRIEEDKVIAGVCSGLGAYTGVDPVVWRIGFVVLALVGVGTGIIAYLVAWLIMPRAPHGQAPPAYQRGDSSWPRGGLGGGGQATMWIGVGLVIIGAWVLFSGFWHPRSGVFWGLLLIAIGAVLWARELGGSSSQEQKPGAPPPPAGPMHPGTGPQGPPERDEEAGATGSPEPPPQPPATATLPPSPPPQPPAPPASVPKRGSRREPSILGRLVVGAAALAIGAGVLLDNLGAIRLTVTGMLAVLLAIVGTGLLVGTYWGRARWLAIPGLLLALSLVTVSLIPFHLEGGMGEVTWQPTRLVDVERSYRHAAGEAVLDLSQVGFGNRRTAIDVRVGFGQLIVVVPDDVDVVVDARVQGGEATLFGRRISGWDVGTRVVDRGDGAGPVHLEARVTFGEIIVHRHGDGALPTRSRSSRTRFGGTR